MPILGILASSRPAIAADTGAMDPLQVVTVGAAGASSITFSNIPNTYEHLQVRMIARDTRAVTLEGFKISLIVILLLIIQTTRFMGMVRLPQPMQM